MRITLAPLSKPRPRHEQPGRVAHVKPHAASFLLGRSTLLLIAIALLSCTSLNAQRIIYDQGRDKTAQDAEKASKDVTSGDLFTKMLHNVDLEAQQEADTQMAFVEQQMRAKLENFKYWNYPLTEDQKKSQDKPISYQTRPDGSLILLDDGYPILKTPATCASVICELKSLQITLRAELNDPPSLSQDQIKARLDDLEKKKKALDAALKELQEKKPSNDPAIVQAFTLLNDNGKEVIKQAQELAGLMDKAGQPVKGLSSALDQLGNGLDEVLSLYNAVKGIWEGYDAIRVDPLSLRPPREQTDLLLLALEQDHLKTIARIHARRQLELGAALDRVETALSWLDKAHVGNSTARVEDTLRAAARAADRDALTFLLDGLHEAAAAVAQTDAAGRLAVLRLSDEQRRYSIRRSAVNSGTYEQTIQAASQRLALYWKSGIKPADLAQLMFYVANTAGVAAIASK